MSLFLQETKCVKAKAIVHQRGSTKTPQLKHSNVADWLDTPGEVVKKTDAVPPTLGADLVVVGTGAAGVGSLAPVLAGFSPFDGTLWPLAANVLPNPVSAPPPAALTWQRPQASLVCWAYAGNASAGRGAAKAASATIDAVANAPANPNTSPGTGFNLRSCLQSNMSDLRNSSGVLVRALFFGRFLVLIRHLRQLVCNAPVAVDAGQARFEPFGHHFCRSFGLLVRVHSFGRVTVAAFV